MRQIYLDNAATTPVDPEVFKAMKPFLLQKFGNASEFHALGQEARQAVEEARKKLASFFGASLKEIIFTGSATESINFCHKGLIEALLPVFQDGRKPHIITSVVEHKAVLETCQHLEHRQFADLTLLPVDRFGQIGLEDIKKAIRPETVLVSIMYVNNEIGTIQPIPQISRLIRQVNKKRAVNRKSPVYFHTDATQAIQYLNCNVRYLGVDLLSLTGHKIYAPKGVGALYIKQGTPLTRQLDGGGQEFNLRAGTENVPSIIGLGYAIESIAKLKTEKIIKLRDRLIAKVLEIPGVILTGHPQNRAGHIASFIIERVEGEAVVLLLSDKKITASTGSACNSNNLQPSHVLTAAGFPPEKSHGSLRFSLGKETTAEDINYVVEILSEVILKLRKIAPKL